MAQAVRGSSERLSYSNRKSNQSNSVIDLLSDQREDSHGGTLEAKSMGKAAATPRPGRTNASTPLSMGLEKMPSPAEILDEAVLWKLTSQYKWKPMRLALTLEKLAMSQADEIGADASSDLLKDSIPLEEIVEIKKTHSLPERPGTAIPQLKRQAFEPSSCKIGDDDSENKMHMILLRTIPNGHNSGRDYYFRTQNEAECTNWISTLKSAKKQAAEMLEKKQQDKLGKLKVFQMMVKRKYDNVLVHMAVACLISFNFAACIAQAQMNVESGSSQEFFFNTLDTVFTAMFALELSINLFSNWFWPFFGNGWCLFDFIVVLISLVALTIPDLPGITQLRLIRVLRVLRLFGRLTSFRQIMNALIASIIPVFNAFLILGIVTAIYAILAVQFFGNRDSDLFGTFDRSFFTMFQVCTGDGWAQEIARGLFEDGQFDSGVVVFFVSFVVLVGWTLLQVVVAVLLDNFMTAAWNEKQERQKEKMLENGRGVEVSVLDPLLAAMSNFDSLQSLRKQLATLFELLDVDDTKTLNYLKLQEGLKKLNLKPEVNLQPGDFDEITSNRELCKPDGELGPTEFENVMRHQLGLYVQRQMAEAMGMSDNEHASTLFFVMKTLTINLEEMASTLRSTLRGPHIEVRSSATNRLESPIGGSQQRSKQQEKGAKNVLESPNGKGFRSLNGSGGAGEGRNGRMRAIGGSADKGSVLDESATIDEADEDVPEDASPSRIEDDSKDRVLQVEYMDEPADYAPSESGRFMHDSVCTATTEELVDGRDQSVARRDISAAGLDNSGMGLDNSVAGRNNFVAECDDSDAVRHDSQAAVEIKADDVEISTVDLENGHADTYVDMESSGHPKCLQRTTGSASGGGNHQASVDHDRQSDQGASTPSSCIHRNHGSHLGAASDAKYRRLDQRESTTSRVYSGNHGAHMGAAVAMNGDGPVTAKAVSAKLDRIEAVIARRREDLDGKFRDVGLAFQRQQDRLDTLFTLLEAAKTSTTADSESTT